MKEFFGPIVFLLATTFAVLGCYGSGGENRGSDVVESIVGPTRAPVECPTGFLYDEVDARCEDSDGCTMGLPFYAPAGICAFISMGDNIVPDRCPEGESYSFEVGDCVAD